MSGKVDRPDSLAVSDSPCERSYVDPEGIAWRVFVQVRIYDTGRQGRSLIFASETVVRRVRNFPDDWRERANAELERLSWSA